MYTQLALFCPWSSIGGVAQGCSVCMHRLPVSVTACCTQRCAAATANMKDCPVGDKLADRVLTLDAVARSVAVRGSMQQLASAWSLFPDLLLLLLQSARRRPARFMPPQRSLAACP
jgi:hypothetical protein